MTGEQFRRLALNLPDAEELSHMGHPDFRVRKKVFASLSGEGEKTAMVRLSPDRQSEYLQKYADAFAPAAGAWGRGGATMINLNAAKVGPVKAALQDAWRHVAPKGLVESMDREVPE